MSKDKAENETYVTTNFHICVWLQMNGIALEEVTWPTTRRAKFIFEDFEGRDTLVSSFFKQDQIQKYISTAQETKARMYATNSPIEYGRS